MTFFANLVFYFVVELVSYVFFLLLFFVLVLHVNSLFVAVLTVVLNLQILV